MELLHTCYRVTNPERSIAFYEALGLEKGRELPIRDEAINYFRGVPGRPQPELELTDNFGVDSYELGTGYGHVAPTVDDLDATLEQLAGQGSSRSGRRTRCGKAARAFASFAIRMVSFER
jgi:lactoylglutathione lyase